MKPSLASSHARPIAGFSLLECLISLGILAILLGLTIGGLYQLTRPSLAHHAHEWQQFLERCSLASQRQLQTLTIEIPAHPTPRNRYRLINVAEATFDPPWLRLPQDLTFSNDTPTQLHFTAWANSTNATTELPHTLALKLDSHEIRLELPHSNAYWQLALP